MSTLVLLRCLLLHSIGWPGRFVPFALRGWVFALETWLVNGIRECEGEPVVMISQVLDLLISQTGMRGRKQKKSWNVRKMDGNTPCVVVIPHSEIS